MHREYFQSQVHSSAAMDRSTLVKQLSARHGFFFCGISKAEKLENEARQLEQWLNQNLHGKMAYMSNYFDLRTDPRLLVPGARSVISLAFNYFPPHEKAFDDPEALKISRYAQGEDYHKVVRRRLKALVAELRSSIGDFDGRVFVDSAPVLEKAWAKRSGIGWLGKHTNIINKEQGSYFFLAEIISDLELAPDGAIKDYCGTCTRCIDACPTDAIFEPYKLDASKCISYLTIELKEAIPDSFKGKMENWIFGCDICQEVCPWNRFSRPHKTPEFLPKAELQQMNNQDWLEITAEVFDRVFEKSAVKRTKLEGLKRNVAFVLQEKTRRKAGSKD